MVAQEWNGRKLNSSVYFEPDEQGLDLFAAYLTSLKREPVRLLVDLIEEEFRQVKIPLLRGPDRQEIINRNYAKFFRSSKFRFAKQIEVVKKQRKEEQILVAGLTNPDLLNPWLEIIDRTATPLSGIQSLPIVSEELINHIKPTEKCVILVSQQVPSNLRQSVFLNGKLILSRLVPIASFYQGDYAEDVIRDIESTQRYLVSQRIIDRSEVISIYILSNERHYEKLTVKCAETSYFVYEILKIKDLIEQEKIDVDTDQDFSSALFCYYATKKLFANHYAKNKEKKYFNHYLASVSLKIISVALIAIALGVMATSIVKGFFYQESVKEMALLEQKYNSKYNQLNEQRVDSTTGTIKMKNVVQAVEKIEKSYLNSPYELMALVSQDIALFPDMRVNDLEWFLASSPTANKADEQVKKTTNRRRSRNRRTPNPGNKLFEIITIKGELINFEGDYRYALSVINDIEDTMKVTKKYHEVVITKRPLNIESNERLSGDVSNRLNKARSGKRAEFGFRVVREVDLSGK